MTTIYRIRWTRNERGVVETGLGDGYGTREQAEAICRKLQRWHDGDMAKHPGEYGYTMTYTVEPQVSMNPIQSVIFPASTPLERVVIFQRLTGEHKYTGSEASWERLNKYLRRRYVAWITEELDENCRPVHGSARTVYVIR